MRVFLDDERQPPPGWVLVRWPDEVIRLLEAGGVEALSLDHDLGDDDRGTGYEVLLWVEQAVATRGFVPPRIIVHSANPAARIALGVARRPPNWYVSFARERLRESIPNCRSSPGCFHFASSGPKHHALAATSTRAH